MRRFQTILAAALLVIGTSGCAAIDALHTTQTAVTTPFKYQDATVDTATLTYNALGSAGLVYLTSPHADPILKQKIKDADAVVFKDLQAAWKAQDDHSNAAVAVALDHMNTDNGLLRGALQLAGVTIP